jgi:hypothetical protein
MERYAFALGTLSTVEVAPLWKVVQIQLRRRYGSQGCLGWIAATSSNAKRENWQ